MSLDAYHHIAEPPGTAKAPLLFAFHGTGGDERQFPGLIRQILPDAGIVSPRGDVLEHGASRFFRRIAEGVYDMDDLVLRTTKMCAFIRAHKDRYAGNPVYGLGYSNGANILAAVVFQAPELFDRVVLMHPLIPWTPASNPTMTSLEVLITAGKNDPIAPLSATESLIRHLEDRAAQVDLVLHEGGHEATQEELAAIAAFFRQGQSIQANHSAA